MIYWTNYKGHKPVIQGKRKKYDNTIYTFDIETTSYIILDSKQYNSLKYDSLSEDEQARCEKKSCLYLWQFGINENVYYGRTYEELKIFLEILEFYVPEKKYIFVHNLSFEFQFLRNIFEFETVFARKSRKPMKCILQDFNIELRCSLFLSNCSLEKLTENYNLPVKKLTGKLNYNKIRHSKTKLTKEEIEYAKYDCLVLYHYIKKEIETYINIKDIPLTSTGKVRKELQELTRTDYKYKNNVRKSVNVDGNIYNLLINAFAGGYTHSNRAYTNEVIKNVVSKDIASSYPFVMVTQKFPSTKFKKISVKKFENLNKKFAYLIRVRFKNISCNFYNTFISYSKCKKIVKGRYDNGRVISAEELEIVLTDVDLRFIFNTHTFGSYEFLEVYYSFYDYLPKKLIEFILEKYVLKTELKGIEEKKDFYAITKAMFNSIYGMCVTNNIKDDVIFSKNEWYEEELTDEKILQLLEKEEKRGFLSFSYGVWVTAYARNNLLENIVKYDEYLIYADTDSLKLLANYDKTILENYNNNVLKQIEKVCNDLKLDKNKYCPKDKYGKIHTIGFFEDDGEYKEFITQGAKKYAYKDFENKIHITVAGVPKSGSKGLKKLKDFKDDFVFEYKYTGKNTLFYCEEMEEFLLTDYTGKKLNVKDKYGIALLPTTYRLSKSVEYSELLSDESSKRAIFKGRD